MSTFVLFMLLSVVQALLVAPIAYVAVKRIALLLNSSAPHWSAPAISCVAFIAIWMGATSLLREAGTNRVEAICMIAAVFVGHWVALALLVKNGKWRWS